jgi:hypothetical protein
VKPSYAPEMCRCGHPTGDHANGRTAWPHPPQRGPCLVGGCGCRQYDPWTGAADDERHYIHGEAGLVATDPDMFEGT